MQAGGRHRDTESHLREVGFFSPEISVTELSKELTESRQSEFVWDSQRGYEFLCRECSELLEHLQFTHSRTIKSEAGA